MYFQNYFKDARYFQILFLSIFLMYGLYFLQWSAMIWYCGIYLITCISSQLLLEYFFGKKKFPLINRLTYVLPSAVITSLSLSLLLKTNDYKIAILAAIISIASKYFLRINGKHIFNPSALGIAAAILLTGNAWISPGQWGSGAIIAFGVSCFGLIVITKVQKLDTSISFLTVFASLLFVRQIIYLGWPMDYFIQSISTGSLLLFTFFMITDPRTVPNNKWARIIWCFAIGIISFYLTTFKYVNGAPIFVLVFAQLLVPLIDTLFKAKTFRWNQNNSGNFEFRI